MATSSTSSTHGQPDSGPGTEVLLASLARVVRPTASPRRVPIIDLPLPDLLIRGLLVASVLLIAAWCLLLAWFSRDAVSLAEGIRLRQEHLRIADHPPMPTGSDLLDAAVFEQARQRFPGRMADLHELRALARADAQDLVGACGDFAAAQAEAIAPLEPMSRLRWAECLAATHRSEEALPLLWGMRLSTLSEDVRGRVIHLLVDLQVAAPTRPSTRGTQPLQPLN